MFPISRTHGLKWMDYVKRGGDLGPAHVALVPKPLHGLRLIPRLGGSKEPGFGGD